MLHPDRRRVVAEAVVALGKAGDRIDLGRLQRFLPRFPVKGGSDPLDVRRSVEIEVDLTETERLGFHTKI